MVVADLNLLVLLYCSPLYAAYGYTAHVVVVVDAAHQHLEGGLLVHFRSGDIFKYGVKQRLQILAYHIRGIAGGALSAGAEQHGGIQLLVGGVQIYQQLQYLVDDLVYALVGAVDLVYHHYDPVAQLQRPAENKAGLGHGALSRVYQQYDAVYHF